MMAPNNARRLQQRKERRAAKKEAARAAKGTGRTEAQYRRANFDARAEKMRKQATRARDLSIPDDVNLEKLYDSDHARFLEIMALGTPSKTAEPFLNRAIWFNELDKKYTFSTDYPNAAKNYALLCECDESHNVPALSLKYFYAIQERKMEQELIGTDVTASFEAREEFLKLWQQADSGDIVIFTKAKLKKFDTMLDDMLEALGGLEVTKGEEGDEKMDESSIKDAEKEMSEESSDEEDGDADDENEMEVDEMDELAGAMGGLAPGNDDWVFSTWLKLRDEVKAGWESGESNGWTETMRKAYEQKKHSLISLASDPKYKQMLKGQHF